MMQVVEFQWGLILILNFILHVLNHLFIAISPKWKLKTCCPYIIKISHISSKECFNPKQTTPFLDIIDGLQNIIPPIYFIQHIIDICNFIHNFFLQLHKWRKHKRKSIHANKNYIKQPNIHKGHEIETFWNTYANREAWPRNNFKTFSFIGKNEKWLDVRNIRLEFHHINHVNLYAPSTVDVAILCKFSKLISKSGLDSNAYWPLQTFKQWICIKYTNSNIQIQI